MTSIFAAWEWIDCDPPPPPDSAYRICYNMANYGWISDFMMSIDILKSEIHPQLAILEEIRILVTDPKTHKLTKKWYEILC